jgi:uncharacterized membrane protein
MVERTTAAPPRGAARVLRHLFCGPRRVRRAFSRATQARIEEAIRACERDHDAELRFVVEGGCEPLHVWRGLTPRERAVALFSELRVWDTAQNSGVLIYVQLADRHIEIVADRGVSAKVAQEEWDAVCRRMEAAFRESRYEEGALAALAEVGALLARHFPARGPNPNELPDAPVVLP